MKPFYYSIIFGMMKADMHRPSLSIERRLWRQGKRSVVGLDEVGVGALAGPVVAAAVRLDPKFRPSKELFGLVRDSKSLSRKQRERAYEAFKETKGFSWTTGRVTPAVIDRINIRNAVALAMRRCLGRMGKVDHALIDGAAVLKRNHITQTAIVRGDRTVFSIAAASIVAKVVRDRYMEKLAKRMPQYRFDAHKGYGTELHVRRIRRHGASEDHRVSFCDHFVGCKKRAVVAD